MKLGELLKAAREEKNVTIQDAEKATKIRTAYLKALEEEKFHLLPGRIYVIGFLKSYANFLGISPEEITGIYKSQFPEKSEEPSQKNTLLNEVESNIGPSKKLYYLIVVLAISILGITSIWYQSSQVDKTDEYTQVNDGLNDGIKQAPIQEPVDDILNQNDSVINHGQPEINETIELTIEIVEQDCWIRVIVDGEEVMSKTVNPGSVLDFTGNNEIIVTFGNAGAAKVNYNGQDLGFMGKKGEVITENFNLP